MSIADAIESHLPKLRRYARAITGSTKAGDDAVITAIEGLDLTEVPERADLALFAALDKTLQDVFDDTAAQSSEDDPLSSLGLPERRALLLSAVEEFSTPDVATIMGTYEEQVDAYLADSENKLIQDLATDVLIIEDEPLIAANLSRLVLALGHTVVGVAQTMDEAVQLGSEHRPALILSDVKLADESLGYDAVAKIEAFYSPTTIYITAYPEQLLQGAETEPAYLIPKPFKPSYVKAVIEQALLSVSKTGNAQKEMPAEVRRQS